MKTGEELNKIIELKKLWAKMMDHGSMHLFPLIEPYESTLCEAFEGCWLDNGNGERYELKIEMEDGRKNWRTWKTDLVTFRKEWYFWDTFFCELILRERFLKFDVINLKNGYTRSIKLSEILKKIS